MATEDRMFSDQSAQRFLTTVFFANAPKHRSRLYRLHHGLHQWVWRLLLLHWKVKYYKHGHKVFEAFAISCRKFISYWTVEYVTQEMLWILAENVISCVNGRFLGGKWSPVMSWMLSRKYQIWGELPRHAPQKQSSDPNYSLMVFKTICKSKAINKTRLLRLLRVGGMNSAIHPFDGQD